MRALHLALASGLCAAVSCIVHRGSDPLPETSQTTVTAGQVPGQVQASPPTRHMQSFEVVRARPDDTSAAAKDDILRHEKDRRRDPLEKVR